jgi:hypothetical protein
MTTEGTRPMTADERWSHLPEPLLSLLRGLRAKAAARARAALVDRRRAFLARRRGEAEKGGST